MKKYIKPLITIAVVLLVIVLLVATILPKYKYAAEKSYVNSAVQNIGLIKECFMSYGLNHGLPTGEDVISIEEMNCPFEINLGKWDEELYGYVGRNFYYSLPVCSRTECSVEAIRWPSASYNLILSDNKRTCYTQRTKLGRYICSSLKKKGWAYANQEI